MIKEITKILKKQGHCKESIDELRNAENFRDVFNMLFDYRIELAQKGFPNIETVRRFYKPNEYGIYLDQKEKIENAYKFILFGDSDCEVHIGDYKCSHIILRHNSKIRLYSGYHASINIYQCEESKIDIIKRGEKSIINIRKL